MTASVPRKAWPLPNAATRHAPSSSQSIEDPRLNDTVALRRCAQYRKAFRGAAVSYPADILRLGAPTDWVKRHGVGVDVADRAGLALALAVGVVPQRIIMHGSDQALPALAEAATAGAGRFVVNSPQQVGALAGSGSQRRRVLVEVVDENADELVAAVISGVGLDMIGVHRDLRGGEDGCGTVRTMIAQMRSIARRYQLIPARLSLGGVDCAEWDCAPDDLAAIAVALDDAVEDGCIAARFPRPAINIAPSRAALIP